MNRRGFFTALFAGTAGIAVGGVGAGIVRTAPHTDGPITIMLPSVANTGVAYTFVCNGPQRLRVVNNDWVQRVHPNRG